jgi:hypothetical protein
MTSAATATEFLLINSSISGVDFMIKTLEIENSAGQREAVKLQIWGELMM